MGGRPTGGLDSGDQDDQDHTDHGYGSLYICGDHSYGAFVYIRSRRYFHVNKKLWFAN